MRKSTVEEKALSRVFHETAFVRRISATLHYVEYIAETRADNFVLFSLFLFPVAIGVWIIGGPMLLNNLVVLDTINCVFFALACVGIVSAIWVNKFAGFSCFGVIAILSNGIIVSSALVVGPEVKGIVEHVAKDAIIINVDEDYRDQYYSLKLVGFDPEDCYGNQKDCYIHEEISYTLVAHITDRTRFYQRYGMLPWLKKRVDFSSLREGQHIQIRYNGILLLSGSIQEAGQVVILDE